MPITHQSLFKNLGKRRHRITPLDKAVQQVLSGENLEEAVGFLLRNRYITQELADALLEKDLRP